MIKYHTFYKNVDEMSGPIYTPRQSRIETYQEILDIIKFYNEQEQISLLDVGGGITLSYCDKSENLLITSTSLRNEEILWGQQNNFNCIEANILELPIQNDVYDVTMAVLTLQYVTNQALGISELLRVTKPGGLVIISYDHTDNFTSNNYLNILNEHGLRKLFKRMNSLAIKNTTKFEEDVCQTIHVFVKQGPNNWEMK